MWQPKKLFKIKIMKCSILLAFAFALPAHAVTSVPKCNHSGFKNLAQLAHYFHKIDPRQTFEQYAKSTGQSLNTVRQQFGATGGIRCYRKDGYEEATAQVVGRNNMISGAAHIFFNNDCTPIDIKNCDFRTINQPKRIYKIKISTVVIKDCTIGKLNSLDDWFVAKLTEPTTATPYLIPDSPIHPSVGDKLTQVAYTAANGFPNTPNIVSCSVLNTQYRLTPYLTDCSIGHGASGGAQLQPTDNQRWIFNAIVSSQNENGHDGGEFDLTATLTSSAPVNGEFWQTLHDMANSDEITTTRNPHDRDSY